MLRSAAAVSPSKWAEPYGTAIFAGGLGRSSRDQLFYVNKCFVGSRLPLVSYLINCLSYFLISHGYMICKLLFITAVYGLLLRIDENMSM